MNKTFFGLIVKTLLWTINSDSETLFAESGAIFSIKGQFLDCSSLHCKNGAGSFSCDGWR